MINKYWFKKRRHGWGRWPSTWEGWAVILVFIAISLFIIQGIGGEIVKAEGILRALLLPLGALTLLLVTIIWKKSEPVSSGDKESEGEV